MVPDVTSLGVINPGTRKKGVHSRVHGRPTPLASFCWAAEIVQMFSISMFACQQCQRVQCLLHLPYTVYNAPVCYVTTEKVQYVSLSVSQRNVIVLQYMNKQQGHSLVNRFPLELDSLIV